MSAVAITGCGGADRNGGTNATATPALGTVWDPDVATADTPMVTSAMGQPTTPFGSAEGTDFAADPDGVRVAVGAPLATTTLFFPLALPSSGTAGVPESAWVNVIDGDPTMAAEVAVFPSTGPAGRVFYTEQASPFEAAYLGLGTSTPLGHGTVGALSVAPEEVSIAWNYNGTSFQVSGDPATLSAAQATAIAVSALDAQVNGSLAPGTIVLDDGGIIAL